MFVCLFVCLDGRQGEADELDCNPLQRVGIPFFRDLASRPGTLLMNLPSMVLRGQGWGKAENLQKPHQKEIINLKVSILEGHPSV